MKEEVKVVAGLKKSCAIAMGGNALLLRAAVRRGTVLDTMV